MVNKTQILVASSKDRLRVRGNRMRLNNYSVLFLCSIFDRFALRWSETFTPNRIQNGLFTNVRNCDTHNASFVASMLLKTRSILILFQFEEFILAILSYRTERRMCSNLQKNACTHHCRCFTHLYAFLFKCR